MATKASMPKARMELNLFGLKIGFGQLVMMDLFNKVESYDPLQILGRLKLHLKQLEIGSAWVANGRIYVGGGNDGSSNLSSIEIYNPTTKQWSNAGNFPENKYIS